VTVFDANIALTKWFSTQHICRFSYIVTLQRES